MGSHVSTPAIVTGMPATPTLPQQGAMLTLRAGSRSIMMLVEPRTIQVVAAGLHLTYRREAGSADAIVKTLSVWGQRHLDAGFGAGCHDETQPFILWCLFF